MSVSDPIADMLTRMRNAIGVKHKYVLMPSSKVKLGIARVLQEEGYIGGFEVSDDRPQPVMKISLKYYDKDNQPVVTGLERVSSPGHRVYVGKDKIPWVIGGIGIAVLSTPKGIMTDKQARRLGTGGEVLCKVW
jgi:small subunit ribosomal protein S8